MKKYPNIVLVVLFAIAFNFFNIQLKAQQDFKIEGEILTFEELMNILVVTASKEEQNISDAPAIIDVITELQIRDFNVTNLYELISMLPGIEMMETFWGRTILNFRGITNSHYTNKVLVMINGNPVYEPVLGSYYLEQIPVASINRIEVIRGPGSSLYGTNAYSGVINIITKSSVGESKLSAGINYGSYNTLIGEISGKHQFNDKLSVFAAMSYTSTNGYPFKIKADEKGRALELDYKNTPLNLFANIKYDNLNIDFSYMTMKKTHYGVTPNIDYTGEHKFNNMLLNAKYSFDLSEKAQASISLRMNSFDNPYSTVGYFPVKGFGGVESIVSLNAKGQIYSGEFQVNLALSDQVSNVSGIAVESYSTDPYNWTWEKDGSLHPFTAYKNSHSSNNIAGYTQFTYRPSKKVSFVGGVRVVKDKDVEDMFLLPRAGVIVKLTDDHSFKLLYGKAFRSPSFFEKYVATTNVLFGNAKLLPETIQTIDAGFEFVFGEAFKARVNGYYEKTADGIERRPTNNPTLHGANAAMYVNASKYNYYGFEISANGLIGQTAYYGFNFGWKDGKNADNDADLFGFSPITANAWVGLRFDEFRITPSMQFVGERKGVSLRKVNNVAIGNFKIDPYVLANLTVGYKINQFLISGTVKNIFDVKYSYPEFIRGLSEEVPGGPGLNYMFSIKFNY